MSSHQSVGGDMKFRIIALQSNASVCAVFCCGSNWHIRTWPNIEPGENLSISRQFLIRMPWSPTVSEVTQYRNDVRALMDRFIRETQFTMPISWDSPMWPVLMVRGVDLRPQGTRTLNGAFSSFQFLLASFYISSHHQRANFCQV